MGELIESSAMLLTLIGIIIAIWFPSISKAFSDDNYFFVEKILHRRLLLLILFSLSYTTIFTPKVIYFTNLTLDLLNKKLPHVYDTVATAYCFMWVTSAFISLFLIFVYIMLRIRLGKMKKLSNKLTLEEWLKNL